MTKVTIHDVAKHAGVSATTVSRVLNNRGYISDEMKEKVQNSINELGFIPNEMARSLFSSKTKIVGLIIPTTANPFFGELTYYIEKYLSLQDYRLLLCNSINEVENEKEYLRMLQENRVDGIIIGSHNLNIAEYQKMPLKMVSVERFIADNIPVVQSDNYQGGILATNKLIAAGCKNILCISGDPDLETPANDRLKAYMACMEEHNLPINCHQIKFTNDTAIKVEEIKELLGDGKKYDGVFAGDDMIATLIYSHYQRLGVLIPEEVKIIGFDGTETIRSIYPHLSTVQQNIEELAKKSVELLLRQINNKTVSKKIILPVKLIESDSSKSV